MVKNYLLLIFAIQNAQIYLFLFSVFTYVQTWAQSFGAVGSDALGHLVGCVTWGFCSMLTDVRTWAQPFGAVVALMRSASCQVCAVALLCSDAYRRSDVGTTIRGRLCSDAVGILSGGCRGSVLMLTDVQTWGAIFRGGGRSVLSSVCRGGSARCLQTFGRWRNLSGRWCSDAVGILSSVCRGSARCLQTFGRGRNLSGAVARCARGILSGGCRGRSALLCCLQTFRRWARPFGGGGVLMRSGGCRGRSALMLTDVQTWGAIIRGRWCSDALGILSSVCRGSARCLQTFRRWAQPFGAVARCARGILSGGCRGRSVELLTDVQTLGTTIRGRWCSNAVGRLPWSLRSDAYGRSDVGRNLSGRSGILSGACRGSARCLRTFRRGRNLSGRWCSDALGHLVGRLPWSLRSDAYRRSDVGRNHSGRSLDALGASCRAVAVVAPL